MITELQKEFHFRQAQSWQINVYEQLRDRDHRSVIPVGPPRCPYIGVGLLLDWFPPPSGCSHVSIVAPQTAMRPAGRAIELRKTLAQGAHSFPSGSNAKRPAASNWPTIDPKDSSRYAICGQSPTSRFITPDCVGSPIWPTLVNAW